MTSSRDELLVTCLILYNIPAYRDKIVGLVIPGHTPVWAITQSILDESGIPYIRIHKSTAEVYSALLDHVSKITAEDTEKTPPAPLFGGDLHQLRGDRRAVLSPAPSPRFTR